MARRPYDAALVNALLAGMTQEKTAQEAGISRATLVRRLADPEFKAELEQAKAELYDRSRRAISAAVPHVIRTLLQAATDPSVAWQNRINASKIILDHTLGSKVQITVDEAEPEVESPRETLIDQMRRLREGQEVIDVEATEAEPAAIEQHRDAG